MATRPRRHRPPQSLFYALLGLILTLGACERSAVPSPSPDASGSFAFVIDPASQTVTLLEAEPTTLRSRYSPDDTRILLPDVDLKVREFTSTFLSGNRVVIRTRFENATDDAIFHQPFFFTLNADSSRIRSATAPLVTDRQLGGDGVLNPGERTARLTFRLTHRGKRFRFLVDASAVVEASTSAVDLRIEAFHLTQATQTLDGGVPLVADREGLARTFVLASEADPTAVTVRLHAFRLGDQVIELGRRDATARVAPTALEVGELATSFNIDIPADWVVPGLAVYLEVDPDDRIAERQEGNNRFPASGMLELDVRETPPFTLTLVPFINKGDSTHARVTEANKRAYVALTARTFPADEIDVRVHAPVVSPLRWPDDTSDYFEWTNAILQMTDTIRIAEGKQRHYYYGLYPPPLLGGLSYLRSPSNGVHFRAASGGGASSHLYCPVWVHPACSDPIQDDRNLVMAHELGHTFGRLHVPDDSEYPYGPIYLTPERETWSIGVHGYDVVDGVLRSPTVYADIEGGDPKWISDYTYRGILEFREREAQAAARQVGTGTERVLLVSGRITGDQVVLDPAFELVAPPTPPAPGVYTLEGAGPNGDLFAVSFAGVRLAEGPADRLHFTFTVPLTGRAAAELNSLRVVNARGDLLALSAPRLAPAAIRPTRATRLSVGRIEVTWDANAYPAALIRDGADGQVLALARNGEATVLASGTTLEIVLSDGVRSETQRIVF